MMASHAKSLSRDMAALRDALVAEKRNASSSQSAKAGRDLLLAALNHLAHDGILTRRLARCGSRAFEGAKRYDCGNAACPVCAARGSSRYFKRTVAPALSKLDPARLRYITVLHSITTDLDAGFREMRNKDHRWLQSIVRRTAVRWWGWREVELHRPADLATFSNRKREMLLALGFPTTGTQPIGLFHTHSIVDLAGGDEATLKTHLRQRWGGLRQVHVQSLMQQRSLMENLRRMVNYSGKTRYTREVGENRREWLDEAEMVKLALFLHHSSRGSQAYRFTINVA